MKINCRISQKTFELGLVDSEILKKVTNLNPWLGKNTPYPKVLPEILIRQIAAYGNTMNFYHSKSAISGKPQLSRYNPLRNKVTSIEEYFTDLNDNTKFGRNYDFNKSFFTQFSELLKDTYLPPLTILNCENCDYVNGVANSKNCYLAFSTVDCEDCLYSYATHKCSSCVDCNYCNDCQYCYDSTNLTDCYQVFSSFECQNSRDLYTCFDCKSCHDCISCSKLEHKSYCIFNKQYSKEEYFSKLNEIINSDLLEKIINDFYLKTDFNNCNTIVNCEDCSGAYIKNSKNIKECFNSYESQDCSFCITAAKSNDCAFGYFFQQDLSFAGAAYFGHNSHFSYSVQHGEGNWYSLCLFQNCNNCFGCIGLNKKDYCILNKQYSKQEYFEMLPRIVEHMKKDQIWGEFLPAATAPYSYDTSFANEWYEPIQEHWIEKIGFYRGELPEDILYGNPSILSSKLSDKDILNSIYQCNVSNKSYKIISKELAFLRKYKLPLPKMHWRERILKRSAARQRMPSLNLK